MYIQLYLVKMKSCVKHKTLSSMTELIKRSFPFPFSEVSRVMWLTKGYIIYNAILVLHSVQKSVIYIYFIDAERIRCPCDRTLSSKQIKLNLVVHVIILLDLVDLFLFFKDKKFLKIKIDFLKMNFDKNCSLSTQVYVNYISCPNNFKISCHPNPSYNSLIISTLLLKNYEDLIPPHLFQTCVIQIFSLHPHNYLYIRGTALDDIFIYVGQHWIKNYWWVPI